MFKHGDIQSWACLHLSLCGGFLVPSLLRWCSREPVWNVKRMPPRNRGHQRSLGWGPSHTFLVLSDSTAKDCFIFQRLRALHFPLKCIQFANCLHVRKGGCNFLSAHGEGSRPGLCCRPPCDREPRALASPRRSAGLGEAQSAWHNAPFSTQNKFCWLWCFDLMKD